jgi:predicted permease
MPRTLTRVRLRLRAILGRRRLEREMQAEMHEHLERATARLVAGGLAPEDARLAARREFGNVPLIQDQARDARGARWVDDVAGDLHFALRYFARHKAAVGLIVTVLAGSTGANTVIFSGFQGMFLRPAPAVPDDAALARVWARERATRTGPWNPRGFTLPELSGLAERRDVFEEVAAYMAHDVVIGGRDSMPARGVRAQFVSSNYFVTLRVPLIAGPGFVREASEAAPAAMTVVTSHELATQLFGDAPGAIGRSVFVNDVPVRVVGVAPPRFQGALREMNDPGLWIPLSARADIARESPRWLDDSPTLHLVARMAPGVPREQGTALVRQLLATTLPDSAARVGLARTADVLAMHALPPGADRTEMLLGFGSMAVIGMLILLVGWMSVSSLMVAAAVARRHEIAVRLSLGASRVRILRQLITESILLAGVGGGAGLVLAWWTLTWAGRTFRSDLGGVDVAPDAGTFAFTLALAVGTGIIFGLSPALHATRGAVAGAIRDSGAGTTIRSRLQRTFVTAQITLSQPLLVILATMLALVFGTYRPRAPELTRQIAVVALRPLMRTGAPGQRAEAVDALIPRIAEHPDVIDAVPEATRFDAGRIVAPGVQAIVHVEGSAPGWFALNDVGILRGRDVVLADTAVTRSVPVVVGSDLASALWGGANAIGRTIEPPMLQGMANDSVTMTVVGVYDASQPFLRRTFGGGAGSGNSTFRVYSARGKEWRRDRIFVRTRGPAEPFIPTLRQLIESRAPLLPVTWARTLAQIDAEEGREALRMAAVAGAGGALALLLASLGLYGVVALAVQQRTREIGIRIAVGASPARLVRMFVGSGLRIGVIALLLGLPLSIVGMRLLLAQGFVSGPAVNVWLIGFGIAAILLGVVAAATWIPARRATRVDPAITLRID